MAEDRRELILLQLLAVLGTCRDCGLTGADVVAAEHVYRNRAQFEDTTEHSELPALALLDGSEATLTQNARNRAPRAMLLTPQIFVVLKPRTGNVNVGEELSAFRINIIRAVLADTALDNLLGISADKGGYIEYRGITTDMQTGSSVEGQMQMDFALAYMFKP